ncbi:MAG: hypothetical protein AB2L24_09075 [Mangrovibacterium sp.]
MSEIFLIYVEVTGWTGKPTPKDIEGLLLNTDVISVEEFFSAD